MDYYSLTRPEQLLILSVCDFQSAVNAWQIYKQFLFRIIGETQEYMQKFMSCELKASEDLPNDKREINLIVSQLRECKNNDVMTYSTAQRILETLSQQGVVHKRNDVGGKASSVFFMDANTRESIKGIPTHINLWKLNDLSTKLSISHWANERKKDKP